MSKDKAEKKTISTPGFIVACMNCHGQLGALADTKEEAREEADRHLSIETGHADHSRHQVTITPTQIVRRKK